MKALLLSAYDAHSHRYWRETLCDGLPEYDWRVETLPARFFNWRIRGNPLSWSTQSALSDHYTFFIATSMVDVSTLRGLHLSLASTPCILYFHENQFAYPASGVAGEKRHLEPLMVQLYAAMSAEVLCFNSEYNRQTFLLGVDKLLSSFPDAVPKNLVTKLEEKSNVLQVPLRSLDDKLCKVAKQSGTIVWNHRWEYDKGPDRLLEMIKQLPETLALTFHVIGQQFRHSPQVFDQIHSLLLERNWLGQWGYIESTAEYHGILERSHLVISTAVHDFQGLSVLEAVQRGCLPIVPDRLAYNEFFDDAYRYAIDDNLEIEARNMASLLQSKLSGTANPEIDLSPLLWSNLRERYTSLIGQCISLT